MNFKICHGSKHKIQMTQFPGKFHSSGIWGIGEWQFAIPWGSGNLKAIPKVPQGILGSKFSA